MSEVLDFFNEEFSTVNRNDIFYTATHPVCSNNFLDFNQALIDVVTPFASPSMIAQEFLEVYEGGKQGPEKCARLTFLVDFPLLFTCRLDLRTKRWVEKLSKLF